ncbi:MAG: hypothetical protein AB7K71_34030 [Polyangiaceae bacterium]
MAPRDPVSGLQGPASFSPRESRPRPVPLEPLALVAHGEVAARLVQHLLTWPDQSQRGERCLADLRAARTADSLFVLAEPRSLPWVDGVQYLGRDTDAPELLLSTHVAPALPLSWLRAALARRASRLDLSAAPPLAVCLEPPRVVSLGAARKLCREDLLHWQRERSDEAVP